MRPFASWNDCPPNGSDYHGRCLGKCVECGEHLLCTGRYTPYCPSCSCCAECGCPDVDGFSHYDGCAEAMHGTDDAPEDYPR